MNPTSRNHSIFGKLLCVTQKKVEGRRFVDVFISPRQVGDAVFWRKCSFIIVMGRKCSTHWDGKSCDSGRPTSTFVGSIFSFPSTKTEAGRQESSKWLEALPNIVDVNKKWTGICEKHWKPGYDFKIVQGGNKRPIHPPTEFGDTPRSLHRQTVSPCSSRNVESRNVLSENRTIADDEVDEDQVDSWDSLVNHCKLSGLTFSHTDDHITLCKISNESFPPKVVFSIRIKKSFNVEAYHGCTAIPLTDILKTGYANKLTVYSQIGQIIEKVESSSMNVRTEIKALGNQLQSLYESDEIDEASVKKLEFIRSQLIAHGTSGQHQGKKYDVYLISEAANLFLRSRNAYHALRSILILPNDKTVRSFFGQFGTAGSENECLQVISDVFESITDVRDKIVFISADEIYVRAAIRYRAAHVIGYAQNHKLPKPAKTILALMVNFMRGKPAFVARLSPVLNLEHSYLFDILLKVVEVIHEAGGYVFGSVTDNLSVNQKTYKKLHETYKADSICSIPHPVPNEHFSSFLTLYDNTHLMKNIRNNWITERTQTLEFVHPYTGKTHKAKWSDIIKLYKLEERNIVKMHTLDYATLYPNNFEKQKVQLVANVFNEKIVALLKMNGMHDTATFVELVTRMWKILNIKSPDAAKQLNDPDREKFTSVDDPRLDFLLRMAKMFKLMDASKKGDRIKCLTIDTANALHQTLHGIVQITKILLRAGYEYVLPGKIQSDRLEGEFGIYRGGSGGNYYISTEQVFSSLSLQRLKLYKILEIEQSSCPENVCCTQGLSASDEDIELVETCFTIASSLNDNERSTLYYISGYVAFKESIGIDSDEKFPEIPVEGEFLELVSRGKLSHPPDDLYDLSMYYYSFFKSRSQKCCGKVFLEAYEEIYHTTDYEFDNISGINRRFSNCFFKAFAKKESSKIKSDERQKNMKKRKLSS